VKKRTALKLLIRGLLPKKLLFLYRIIRKGQFLDYLTQRKQFKKNKSLAASDIPLYLSIATIAKNETSYIAEWIEYHLLIGVQNFFIYDNESTDNLRELLEPYIKEGVVKYFFSPGIRRQVAAYNDVIKRFKHASFWIAFIDVDEFLVPVSAETIPELLHDFEDVPGIEVNQVLYGSNGHQKKTDGLVMERFKHHSHYEAMANRTAKSIVNPRHVFYMATPHVAEYFDGACSVDTNKKTNEVASVDRPALHDKMRLNHYGSKSLEEFTSRIAQGRAASPGKLTVENFYNRDRNEVKDDTIIDKYIPLVKEKLLLRRDKYSCNKPGIL
jgi:hypothetical protein